MLLQPVRIARPDLREEVRTLIGVICSAAEGARIPLVELVRILGISTSDEFRNQLASRGDIVLSDGGFENGGPSILRKTRVLGVEVDMVIDASLRGRIAKYHDSFQMAFEADHTVSLHKFVFRARLRHLDINGERIFVDFTGAQDVFVELG